MSYPPGEPVSLSCETAAYAPAGFPKDSSRKDQQECTCKKHQQLTDSSRGLLAQSPDSRTPRFIETSFRISSSCAHSTAHPCTFSGSITLAKAATQRAGCSCNSEPHTLASQHFIWARFQSSVLMISARYLDSFCSCLEINK